MNERLRDALLAAVVGGGCLLALALGESLGLLGRPTVALVGVGGALAVEALFFAGTPVVDLWRRREVRVLSVLGVLGGGILAAMALGPWAFAAIAWGIATYFGLLALVLAAESTVVDDFPPW